MNILITGCNGQLGNELRVLSALYPMHSYFFTDKSIPLDYPTEAIELDICDEQMVHNFLKINKIELIVNCAAYTSVDKAEQDEDNALKVNAKAVEILSKSKLKIIHISTDYVFDGQHVRPYSETDESNPATVYGKTKLQGERALLANVPEAVIIRTSWLYSSFGNNFVKTMLRLGAEREVINVVFDQVGCPTYAKDLAQLIFVIIQKPEWTGGIFHFSNEGVCSWYDFAVEIFKIKHIDCSVRPILSGEYNYLTPRPPYSVLDKAKVKTTFGFPINHWTVALQNCLKFL